MAPSHGNAAEVVDVAVIGAGPCGLATGIAAGRAGLSCVIFDKDCIVSSISRYPTHMTFFSTAERLEIGGVPFVIVGDRPTRREALRYYQRVTRDHDLDVRQYEEVVGVEAADDAFMVSTWSERRGPRRCRAGAVVVATGYFDSPNLLGVPGEGLAKVAHMYREGHVFHDQDCVVVGGGNSAVDAALELHRWGARVTIVHFESGLDPNVKPWVRPEIEARLRDGGIAARFGCRVAEITTSHVVVRRESDGALENLPNDHVLAMTGYTPDGVLLRSLGVTFDAATGIPHHDPATMETNTPGVFIAGVLSAGYNANKVFIENGRGHGELIAAAVRARRA